MENLEVKCYSGYTYAQRPVSFNWQGVDYQVEEVERGWLEPGERWFLAKTMYNKSFQLCYNVAEGRWSITKPTKEQENAKGNT